MNKLSLSVDNTTIALRARYPAICGCQGVAQKATDSKRVSEREGEGGMEDKARRERLTGLKKV